MEATRRIAAQTRQRLAGVDPRRATRLVSLHDPDARPIRKGRLGKPVEFGYKAQIVDNDDGIVLDHTVETGNPADAPQLAPAIERITSRTGRAPRTVTADRGYGEARVERPARPRRPQRRDPPQRQTQRPGKPRNTDEPSATSQMAHRMRRPHQQPQTRLRMGPHRIDGIEGARIWCGHGVLAHNLVKISALAS